MGILQDMDLVKFARETAERAAAGGETVRRTEMLRCAWLMMELLDIIDRHQHAEPMRAALALSPVQPVAG